MPTKLRASRELRQQPRLTDPRLTDNLDRAEDAAVDRVEHLLDLLECRVTTDERCRSGALACLSASRHRPPAAPLTVQMSAATSSGETTYAARLSRHRRPATSSRLRHWASRSSRGPGCRNSCD